MAVLRDEAHRYLGLGYTPLWVELGGKAAKFSGWQNTQQTADSVDRQFSRPSNLGIRTGDVHPDGTCLAAIDIDIENGAIVSCVERAIGCAVPVKRGKKGWTYLCRLSEQVTSAKIHWYRDGRKIPAIDILCRGAQTVVPPSIHPETKLPYQWVAGTPLFEIPYDRLPVLSPTVIDEIRGFCKDPEDAIHALNNMEWRGVGGGGDTHDVCVRAVSSMVGRGCVLPTAPDKVVLIGGPSRMPIVRQRVPAMLGIATDLDVDPMTAVARGAAIFAESRNWNAGETQAKPSRVQRAAAKVSFDYEARTARDRARVRVTAADGGEGLRVAARASDGRDYGERGVAESPIFVIELGEGETIVRMTVTDTGGVRVDAACADLTITRVAAAAAGAPCTSTIAVKVEGGDGARAVNVLEPLIRKGETLPRTGAKALRAARRIAPGSGDCIDIELFEQAEGVQELEANLLIGAFRLSGEDLPPYAAPLKPGEQVILHWSVDDSQLIRCSVELPEQGLHLRDHSFYIDDLARVDFAANGRAFASQALAGAERAIEAFDALEIGVRTAFADEIDRLRAGLSAQFQRLDQASDADTFRSISEEARLLRQDASRLRHRPKLREHMIRSDLRRIEAESRQLSAALSQADRVQFAAQLATAEQALANASFALADRAIEAMRDILRTAYRTKPGYFFEAFRWLQAKRALSNEPARFDELAARGRVAAAEGDEDNLRQICGAMVRTLALPSDQDTHVAALAGLRR